MGKRKKRKLENTQPVPWCFYCGRTFSEEPILVQHQKARHFRCTGCKKRFVNARQLIGHLANVHKTSIDRVSNAIEGRDGLNFYVSGMRNLPFEHPAVIERMKADPNLAALGTVGGVSLLPTANTASSSLASQSIAVPALAATLALGAPIPPRTDPQMEDLQNIELNFLHDLEGLVYRDEVISPEEKRAKMERYKFDPSNLRRMISTLDKDIDAKLAKYAL